MLLTLVQLNLPLTSGYCIIMQGKAGWNVLTLSSKNHLNFLTFKGTSFVDHLCYFCLFLFCFRARLFIGAVWSPAGKGLTSWLLSVMSNCEVVFFPLVSWVMCGA